jgi:uncharacterized protein (TIGR03437 family)
LTFLPQKSVNQRPTTALLLSSLLILNARGRGWIVISGTVGQAANTFRTQLNRYEVNGKMHIANAAPPSIPEAVESLVAGIRGLDDFYPESDPHPFYSSPGLYALAPDDFGVIYDVTPLWNAGIDGTGQVIVIAGQSDIHLTDVSTFRNSFGLPAQVPRQVMVGPDPGFNAAESEADVDLEWAGAVARNASLIYVYAENVLDATAYAIDNNLAPVISFSFGQCEANLSAMILTAEEDLAKQANAEGITWIVSSGDAGAAACDQGTFPATHGLAVPAPASVPEVTAVGGTELVGNSSQYWNIKNSPTLGSALSYMPENAWNDTGDLQSLAASGGGASKIYAQPYWQMGPGVPNNNSRDVPDLSFSASPLLAPYMAVIQGRNAFAGGTSLSAPSFAGIVTLLNHYLLTNGEQQQPGLGNINPVLYGLAQSTADVFHDITQSGNVVPCQAGSPDCKNGSLGYAAGLAYDQVTGLGSLDVYHLANEWNPALAIGPRSQPPPPPPLSSPANGVIGASLSSSLQWFAAGNADSYDVYFGPYFPPPFWGNTTATNCAPSGITAGTKYYWRVEAKNLAGMASSPTWSFTTDIEYVISTVAGSGFMGYSGDNGIATNAGLWSPAGIALQGADLYFADSANYRIRKVSNGVITSVAGNGAGKFGYGVYSGDGGSPLSAGLAGPVDIAFDTAGNLLIADAGSERVRKVSGGIITTVAGDGIDGAYDDGGLATDATLDGPVGIAINSDGDLFIGDADYSAIREVSSGIITTVTGGRFNAGFSGDNGPASAAQLRSPEGVSVDGANNLFIADTGNNRIRKVSQGVITTIAGNGSTGYGGENVGAISAPLTVPTGVAVDRAGNVYIAESGNNRIRKLSNGVITTIAGNGANGFSGDNGPAINATFNGPNRVAVDGLGNLYVSDTGNNRIRMLVPVLGGPPSQPVPAVSPGGLVNSASFVPVAAAGSIATIWGNYLLNRASSATTETLPTTLSGLSIQIGNVLAPILYASTSLVNLQIPWEVAGQPQVNVFASLNGQSGSAQTVKLVPFAPGIFAMNGQGSGQGAILDASNRLVDFSNPVTAGNMVQIYCTGLGPVTNPPQSGSPASGTVLSNTTATPIVVVGGASATVQFSGLAPGEVGLYQVNAFIPMNALTGDSVPVSISIGGATSNTVTLAIH